jgi:orotate phosphoribosyltransferase
MSQPPVADDVATLIELITRLAVVHGEVILSSGRTADYYVDMRRVTLDGEAAPVVGPRPASARR